MSGFTGGFEGVLAYGVEASTQTSYGISGNTIPALPGTITPIGLAMVPAVQTQRSSKKLFGIGSPFAQADGKGTRLYNINTDIAINDSTLLSYLMGRDNVGYKGIKDLCLVTGNSNIVGGGYAYAHRFCKPNTIGINFTEGAAQEIRAQVAFQGLIEQAGSTLNPSWSDLTALGAPYFWQNVTSFAVNGVAYRDVIKGCNVQVNHNLQPRGFRPFADTGDADALGNTYYSLVPGTFVGKASLTFHEKLAAALRNSTANATIWGDIVITLAYSDKSMTVTLTDCLLDADSQNQGDANTPIEYGCDVLFSNCIVNDTTSGSGTGTGTGTGTGSGTGTG